MVIGLSIILLLVLFLPFTKIVANHLELFLLIMGLLAVTVSQVFSWPLVKEALVHPINITFAVLIAGLLFRWCQSPIEKGIEWISHVMPYRLFIALFVIILGLLSSVITAIVAAIILASVISVLRLDRKSEVHLVVLACYAIGLGAVLTPIGEPLSTVIVNKLHEDFFYLFKLVGTSVIPAVVIFGVLAAFAVKSGGTSADISGEPEIGAGKESGLPATDSVDTIEKVSMMALQSEAESYKDIVSRSLNVYLFVMALTFLGAGFEPLIEAYFLDLSPLVMYWINMVSAILDNATLAAAEISPSMDNTMIKDILMGLLISGGMLIPGNIPNIISAGKLRITSAEYARFAFPIGLAAMVLYFIIVLVI